MNRLKDYSISKRLTYLDKFFLGLIFILITQLYRVFGVLLGISSIMPLTAALTFFCAAYLTLKKQAMRKTIYYYGYFVFGIVYPATTIIYAQSTDLRSVGLQIHYLLILLSSAYFFQRVRTQGRILIFASFAISGIAMLMSIAWPSLFSTMAAVASARFDYLGRGAGLFLQPNLLAYNFLLIAMMYACFISKNQIYHIFWGSLLLMLCLLLTGSRGGMVAGFAFISLWIFQSGQLKNKRLVPFIVISICFLLVITPIFILIMSDSSIDFSLYTDRISSMLSSQVINDGSVQHRIDFQSRFLDLIWKNPIFGYGIGSVNDFLDTGELYGAAHNQFLDTLLQYGFLGLVLLVCGGVFVWRTVNKKFNDIKGATFILPLFIAMFSTNMILEMQNFYVLLGLLLSKPKEKAC